MMTRERFGYVEVGLSGIEKSDFYLLYLEFKRVTFTYVIWNLKE